MYFNFAYQNFVSIIDLKDQQEIEITLGLPQLKGSANQIPRAQFLRRALFQGYAEQVKRLKAASLAEHRNEEFKDLYERMTAPMLEFLARTTDAGSWISHSGEDLGAGSKLNSRGLAGSHKH